MEKKANVENSMQKKGLWILKSLLCAYLVTGVLLLILTVLLYKCGLEEKHVSAGILTVYQSTENTNGYFEEEILLNELFKTASWKLHPLREDYRIWLDDCVRVGNKKAKSESDPIELFDLIDQTTGTTFTVSIRVVFDDERLISCID